MNFACTLFVPSEHLVIGRQFIACATIIPLISPIGTIEHVTQAKFFRWIFTLFSVVPTGLYGSFIWKQAMNCLPISSCPYGAYTDSRNVF